jgi:hypothetical protein
MPQITSANGLAGILSDAVVGIPQAEVQRSTQAWLPIDCTFVCSAAGRTRRRRQLEATTLLLRRLTVLVGACELAINVSHL